MRVSRSGGWTSVISPCSKRERRRSSRVAIALGATVGADHDLLAALVQVVERVEELLLGGLAPLQGLDVVDQEDVGAAVAVLERLALAVAHAVDPVVGEGLGGDVVDAELRLGPRHEVADGVQQVGLAQAHAPVDEQRVVGLGRLLGHGHGRRVGEAVGGAHHEALEGEPGLQAAVHARAREAREAGRRPAGAARPAPRRPRRRTASPPSGPDLDAHVHLAAQRLEEGVLEEREVALHDPAAREVRLDGQGQAVAGEPHGGHALEGQLVGRGVERGGAAARGPAPRRAAGCRRSAGRWGRRGRAARAGWSWPRGSRRGWRRGRRRARRGPARPRGRARPVRGAPAGRAPGRTRRARDRAPRPGAPGSPGRARPAGPAGADRSRRARRGPRARPPGGTERVTTAPPPRLSASSRRAAALRHERRRRAGARCRRRARPGGRRRRPW